MNNACLCCDRGSRRDANPSSRASPLPAAERVEELRRLVEHTIARDYPEVDLELDPAVAAEGGAAAGGDGAALSVRVLAFLRAASGRFATLTAEWIRVGCSQRSGECRRNAVGHHRCSA